ncbi:MAG: hypothetical protein NT091_01275 [Candidatus Falkowbacteria bacterium]|nr:hypothetical protein [Candidatus Falkowbacteria bacterium]
MKFEIEIDEKILDTAVKQVMRLQGNGSIGNVYLAGSWNRWGDSMEKTGCIRPKPESQMYLRESNGNFSYVLEVDLPVGFHNFKPVVVASMPDENGMCSATWIHYPGRSALPYVPDQDNIHGNWQVMVNP